MRQTNKITDSDLSKFAAENSWHKKMSSSRGLDSYDNYIGPGLGDLVVVAVSRSRDSEILDESNFESALDMLGGESDSVEIHRFGHWGCGWFEIITVDPKDTEKLKIAYEIKRMLEHYPVLDDSDCSERENEAAREFAEEEQDRLARAISKHLGLSDEIAESDEMLELAYLLSLECQMTWGLDSCLNIYSGREPDERDWSEFMTVLRYLEYSNIDKTNPAYQLVCACFDMNGGD